MSEENALDDEAEYERVFYAQIGSFIVKFERLRRRFLELIPCTFIPPEGGYVYSDDDPEYNGDTLFGEFVKSGREGWFGQVFDESRRAFIKSFDKLSALETLQYSLSVVSLFFEEEILHVNLMQKRFTEYPGTELEFSENSRQLVENIKFVVEAIDSVNKKFESIIKLRNEVAHGVWEFSGSIGDYEMKKGDAKRGIISLRAAKAAVLNWKDRKELTHFKEKGSTIEELRNAEFSMNEIWKLIFILEWEIQRSWIRKMGQEPEVST